jgi:hypothetical protein
MNEQKTEDVALVFDPEDPDCIEKLVNQMIDKLKSSYKTESAFTHNAIKNFSQVLIHATSQQELLGPFFTPALIVGGSALLRAVEQCQCKHDCRIRDCPICGKRNDRMMGPSGSTFACPQCGRKRPTGELSTKVIRGQKLMYCHDSLACRKEAHAKLAIS